ncbi:MAG TPA: DUF3418 domain-containing protein [Candidatus Lumbricidophila sp.]|nr:DUF3418 domain-containing protein [Candidatus Lumbricidophila sp.]
MSAPYSFTYPPELPVSAQRGELATAIAAHQVVVVAGATGSGKTTQLPKICLELGRERIAHTQPRRIAARTIAERIAEETGTSLGGLVGYQVRFTDQVSADTRIAVMTDGILLNQMHRDRDLARYDTIIIDEAHERSLNIDFLIGYLTRLVQRRPDLKVIITSATIDPARFAEHFSDATGRPVPVIEVSGRTFPVEIRYRPLVAEAGAADAAGSGSAEASDDEGAAAEDRDVTQGVLDALAELEREAPGDVLVFLSGESEIRDAEAAVRADAVRRGRGDTTEVLPLYGRLSSADQHRVFEPSKVAGLRRRVILATNVAETSLTVPGIRYVIDAGTARISRYSARSKVQRLPIEAISQASANQRSGRCGRTSSGIAIRLYAEDDFEKRPEFTDPEILRTSLASVILQAASLDLGPLEEFPFLTPPDTRGVRAGTELLRELGAIEATTPAPAAFDPAASDPERTGDIELPLFVAQRDRERQKVATRRGRAAGAGTAGAGQGGSGQGGAGASVRLTRIGRQLARLPIEPRFARMVVESKQHGTTREVLAIVAGLTILDPRERPLAQHEAATAMHQRFADPTSDFMSLVNLWNHLETQQRELSGSAFRRMCKAEFLNYLRVREWQDLYRQLARLAKPLGLHIGDAKVNPDGIHRSILAGLLSQLGLRDDRDAIGRGGRGASGGTRAGSAGGRARVGNEFLGSRETRFAVFPGSGLAKRPPAAVMCAELVETSRLFARTVAAIDLAWAEPIAGSLVVRSYSEPRWDPRGGSAVVDEKVTLYGLPIVPKRRLQLARIDQPLARELFIRHALVEDGHDWGKLGARFAFLIANRELRADLAALEARTRRREVLLGDEAVFAFYATRLPATVFDTRSFERWVRGEASASSMLRMTREALIGDVSVAGGDEEFPETWTQGEQRLALRYRFEPGAVDDGVSVLVPLAVLPTLTTEGFDWQVPGLRHELVTALLKSLPKVLRREVVPAAEWASRLLDDFDAESDGPRPPLLTALADAIRARTYATVDPSDFDLERVPVHLQVLYSAVDDRGRVVERDRDLVALQRRLAERAGRAVAQIAGAAGGTGAAHARGGRPGGGGRGSRPGTTASQPGTRAFPERTGLTTWDFDTLPDHIEVGTGGVVVRGFPALVDEGTTVALRVLPTAAERDRALARGIRRLLLLASPSPAAYVLEHLTNDEKLTLGASAYAGPRALLDDCVAACVDDVVRERHVDGTCFTRAEFEAARDAVSAALLPRLDATVGTVIKVLRAAREADRAITKAASLHLMRPLADARTGLDALVPAGFISATGLAQLRHLPRYLDAITVRVRRLVENPGRDRQAQTEVDAALEAYAKAGGELPSHPDAPANLVRTRWLLEELRVSLFAQELKAAVPVSLQRIRKALAAE